MRASFRAAVGLLAHPVPLGAVGIMLLNDFILKPLAPSWWTGKLSDFAGLIFLPLILAAFLTWLVPARLRCHWQVTGALALGSVLVGFILLKADVNTNHWMLNLLRAGSGFNLAAAVDPTDLLALPVLLIPAWLWFRQCSPGVQLERVSQQRPTSAWRYLILAAATLTALADAAMPDPGVNCLLVKGDAIVSAGVYGNSYISQDGGLTWQSSSVSVYPECTPQNHPQVTTLDAPGGVSYRFLEGQGVERSLDGGQTWQMAYQVIPWSQAEESYLKRNRSGNPYFRPGPLDAVIDPHSGNLVLAMGQEGVLVGTPGGEWRWADVGSYWHSQLRQDGLAGVVSLLGLEIFLALAAALLWLVTASLRPAQPVKKDSEVQKPAPRRKWLVVLTVLGWIFLAAAGFTLQPGIADQPYVGYISPLATMFACAWVIMLLVITLVRQGKEGLGAVGRLAVYCLPLYVLLLLPFVLWAFNILPYYWMADGVAVVVLVIAVIALPLNRAKRMTS